MRKLLFPLYIISILISCQGCGSVKTQEDIPMQKLTGIWLRQGDASAGDTIKIQYIQESNQFIGVLTKVSQHSKMFGYQPGDVKWKFIRINDDHTILIQNLNSTITREEESGRILSTEKTYGPFLITVIDENHISMQNQGIPDNRRIGNHQTWRRISK